MANEFIIKNGFYSYGNSAVTGSLIISSSGINDLQIGTNKLTVSTAGNVGIGLNTPISPLQVRSTAIPGDAETIAQFDVSDDSSYLRIQNATGTNSNFIPTLHGRNSSNRISLYLLGNGTTDTGTDPLIYYNARIGEAQVATRPLFQWNNYDSIKMIMLANGNLGIGTETPSYKLDASGNVRLKEGSAELIINSATWSELKYGADNYFRAQGDQAIISGPLIRLFDGSQETMRITGSNVSIGTTVTSPTARLHVNNTNNTINSFLVEDESNPDASPFVIDTDGKVGIGIGTPTAPLHVHVIASPSTGETLANFTVSDDLNSGLKIINNTGTDGRFTPNIYSTGNHPQSALVITGNTLDDNGTIPITIFDSRKNGVTEVLARPLFSWRNYGTPVMQINANGNVGIGTITPNAKLDVNGDTIITGSLTVTNNFTVLGSSSIQYITSSQLNIGDNIISVNTINPGFRFGGISVIDSGSSPQVSGSLLFDSQNNQWIFVHQNTIGSPVTSSVLIMGPQTYDNVGNETTITANRLTKGTGGDLGEHIGNSNITDTGTLVSINSNTVVTGSLTIIQTGSANAFVVYDSNSDSSPFVIDSSGSVGMGYSTPSSLSTKLYVSPDISGFIGIWATGFNNHGIKGTAAANNKAGIYGEHSTDAFVTGIGVHGRATYNDTPFNGQQWIGGKFEAAGDSLIGNNYSVQLRDGTEAAGKVLVSQDSSGSANWSTRLSGSYEITGSLTVTGNLGGTGGSIDMNAMIQASLLYLSNNF